MQPRVMAGLVLLAIVGFALPYALKKKSLMGPLS